MKKGWWIVVGIMSGQIDAAWRQSIHRGLCAFGQKTIPTTQRILKERSSFEDKKWSLVHYAAATAGISLGLGIAVCNGTEDAVAEKKRRILKEGSWARVAGYKPFSEYAGLWGDNCNKKDMNGQTYLMKACAYGEALVVEVLLQEGADVTLCDIYENNAFHLTALCFCDTTPDILSLLLRASSKEHKEALAKGDCYGRTPLMNLCKVRVFDESNDLFEQSFDLLVGQGADLSVVDHRGRNAAFYLVSNHSSFKNGQIERLLTKLKQSGCSLLQKDANGHSLVDYVVINEKDRTVAYEKAQALIGLGVKPSWRYYWNFYGQTILYSLFG